MCRREESEFARFKSLSTDFESLKFSLVPLTILLLSLFSLLFRIVLLLLLLWWLNFVTVVVVATFKDIFTL